MTAPPWMPLYVADYLADTGHLSCEEHGAYLLLIMHYWRNGGLPTEDAELARICRLPLRKWRGLRGTLARFFDENWRHKRVDKELAEAAATILKRSAAGTAGASARYGKRIADAEQSHAPSPSPSPKEEKDAAGAAPLVLDLEADLFRRGEEVLGANANGVIAKLLKAKGNNIALARAAVERASTKQDPREYVGAIIRRGNAPASVMAVRKVAL